jgi:hypothetical protein
LYIKVLDKFSIELVARLYNASFVVRRKKSILQRLSPSLILSPTTLSALTTCLPQSLPNPSPSLSNSSRPANPSLPPSPSLPQICIQDSQQVRVQAYQIRVSRKFISHSSRYNRCGSFQTIGNQFAHSSSSTSRSQETDHVLPSVSCFRSQKRRSQQRRIDCICLDYRSPQVRGVARGYPSRRHARVPVHPYR